MASNTKALLAAAIFGASIFAGPAIAQDATNGTDTMMPVEDDDGEEGKWGLLGLLGLAGLAGLKKRDRHDHRDNHSGTGTGTRL